MSWETNANMIKAGKQVQNVMEENKCKLGQSDIRTKEPT